MALSRRGACWGLRRRMAFVPAQRLGLAQLLVRDLVLLVWAVMAPGSSVLAVLLYLLVVVVCIQWSAMVQELVWLECKFRS